MHFPCVLLLEYATKMEVSFRTFLVKMHKIWFGHSKIGNVSYNFLTKINHTGTWSVFLDLLIVFILMHLESWVWIMAWATTYLSAIQSELDLYDALFDVFGFKLQTIIFLCLDLTYGFFLSKKYLTYGSFFHFQCSWSDAVLWNPHLQMEACYRDFVCVENAKVPWHFGKSLFIYNLNSLFVLLAYPHHNTKTNKIHVKKNMASQLLL